MEFTMNPYLPFTKGWKPHSSESRLFIQKALPQTSMFDDVKPADSADLSWQNADMDQEALGSCTANAVAQGIGNCLIRVGKPFLYVSRLYLYYIARDWAGEVRFDAGSQVSTVLEVAARGVPLEEYWKYDITRFTEMPDTAAFMRAQASQAVLGIDYVEFGDVADPVDLIRRANSAGYTVQFGSMVTTDYTDKEPTEIIHLNSKATDVGGHAQSACGFSDAEEFVLVKGSWGRYGDRKCPVGCARFGYDYVRARFRDMCVIVNPPRNLAA